MTRGAAIPASLYFTSGTTSKPKMVLHTQTSYPVGHLSTLYWLGLQAGDVHLNISSPGWAKHAWSCFFAPWQVGATVFIYNQGRFDAARRRLATISPLRRHQPVRAADRLAFSLILEDLKAYPVQPARADQRRRAAESGSDRAGEEPPGASPSAKAIGQTESTAMLGNPPGQPVRLRARWAGRCRAMRSTCSIIDGAARQAKARFQCA